MAEQTAAQRTAAIERMHKTSSIVEVRIDELKVDRSYQREPSQALVEEITASWDEVASELILVSDRGKKVPPETGGKFIVNGQHRTLAAAKIGRETIWARVIDTSKLDDPGELEANFRLKTNVRLGDRPLERFRALVRSGDEDAIGLVKLLERFNTYINEQPQEEGINAVRGAEKLYKLDQGHLLGEILELLRDTFDTLNAKTCSGLMMNATGWFILAHSAEADRGHVVERLRSNGIPAIDRKARIFQSTLGGSLWMNFYRAFVDVYNDRLRESSRLDFKMRGINNWGAKATTEAAWGKRGAGVLDRDKIK